MKFSEFRAAVQVSTKIFVWVEFSHNHIGFLQTTKAAIREFIEAQTIDEDEYVYATVVDRELYIGAPNEEA